MEKRVMLAIVLMIAVIVVTNIIFPPVQPPPPEEDPEAVEEVREEPRPDPDRDVAVEPEPPPDIEPEPEEEEPEPFLEPPDDPPPSDTVRVSTPVLDLLFETRGASIVRAELPKYASYAEDDPEESRVQMIQPGDRWLGWRLAVGPDTLDLRDRLFEPSATEVTVREGDAEATLTFRDSLPEFPGLAFRLTYRFQPDRYLVDIEGEFEGIGARGFSVHPGLGRGLRTNEADPDEDLGQLEFVVRGAGGGINSEKIGDVEAGERRSAEGSPFQWVAVKNKYFLFTLVAPDESPGFGGLTVMGTGEPHSADMEASLPVPAGDGTFRLQVYVGPQEFDRLATVGHDLQNVNPYGWGPINLIIRPLVGIVMAILTWMHSTLGLAYGWVLILFGVMMRIVLFPLYQKSMRSQMGMMEIQPLMKELQEKYKDEPQKMQREMMRLYKEHDVNPLMGCLPMMLPFPVLITLFFVFQNTIEFRGVPFMWLPDLSLQDPYYIIPVVMGISMYLLQAVGQRGMEVNLQMKLMRYILPVVFTVIFLRFPSGLNLYYATSNLASLPQQFYISKERRKMKAKQKAGKKKREKEKATAGAGSKD